MYGALNKLKSKFPICKLKEIKYLVPSLVSWLTCLSVGPQFPPLYSERDLLDDSCPLDSLASCHQTQCWLLSPGRVCHAGDPNLAWRSVGEPQTLEADQSSSLWSTHLLRVETHLLSVLVSMCFATLVLWLSYTSGWVTSFQDSWNKSS